MAALFATPVSVGLLPVILLPVAALTPLPASEFHGSVAVCAQDAAEDPVARGRPRDDGSRGVVGDGGHHLRLCL